MTNSGQQFGKYRILEKLGAGGFATVYKAVDTTLDRQVALKVLHPQLLTDQRFVQNFRQEAKTLAALRHPQIVTIYEVGETDGRLFIAMEMAHGLSLGQSISRRGRIPWREMLTMLKPICDALDYAHSQNIVHRDLKPANLLLDTRRGVLMTDFGFARLMAETTASMSVSGGIVGTPGYIAPEVWESNAATAPVDIYALGCIVYEMLTGDVLFKGQTPIQAVYAHSRGPQFPSAWPDDVPPGVTAVLAKALARDPADRYASAGALWQALDRLNSRPQPTREAAKPIDAASHAQNAKPVEAPQQEAQPANITKRSTDVEPDSRIAPAPVEAQPIELAQQPDEPAKMPSQATALAEDARPVAATQTAIPSAPPSTLSIAELVLILLAIMIDIGGGQISKALQLPLWIDTTGTILVGALLGPWIGAITGLLGHSLWWLLSLNPDGLWFTPVAGVCGLLAGFAGRLGVFRRASPRWLGALIGGVFTFALTLFVFMYINSIDQGTPRPIWPVAGDIVKQNALIFMVALVLGTAIGYFVLGSAGYAGTAGLITGVVTTLVTAPIAAYFFGNDSGVDAVVEAFSKINEFFWAILLGQNTVADPFDRLTGFLIVYLIIQLLPQWLLRRFRNMRAIAQSGIER